MIFKEGQRVVCIDNSKMVHTLILNGIYTIKSFRYDGWIDFYEADLDWYRPTCFRPIVDIGDEVEEYIKQLEPETVEA